MLHLLLHLEWDARTAIEALASRTIAQVSEVSGTADHSGAKMPDHQRVRPLPSFHTDKVQPHITIHASR